MIPRSSIGRSIVKEVDTGVSQTVEQSQERKIVLKKKTRESLLGVRFGLHPVSGQVVVTHMFDGYPAASSGRIFIGDVLTAVNGVMVTSVDMATQVIKLAEDRVELKTTNVYVNASNPGSRRASAAGGAWGLRFDPNTGQPIPKFDPTTGKQNWGDGFEETRL